MRLLSCNSQWPNVQSAKRDTQLRRRWMEETWNQRMEWKEHNTRRRRSEQKKKQMEHVCVCVWEIHFYRILWCEPVEINSFRLVYIRPSLYWARCCTFSNSHKLCVQYRFNVALFLSASLVMYWPWFCIACRMPVIADSPGVCWNHLSETRASPTRTSKEF